MRKRIINDADWCREYEEGGRFHGEQGKNDDGRGKKSPKCKR